MKVHVVGGFLGAGKTTAVRRLAEHLRQRGERVAIITNDQGHGLVDTEAVRASAAEVREIGGGCFCCRYGDLEQALDAAADAGMSVAVTEAVGSCADLIATVLSPLADRRGVRFQVAPLSIVVDPWRVRDMARGAFSPDVAYLFRKQIEEADVIVVSRADASPPDVGAALRELAPAAAIVPFSGKTGEGAREWLAARPAKPSAPLVIDYERYGAAEAALGWLNGHVVITAARPFAPRALVLDILGALRALPIAHVKLAVVEPNQGTAAIVRRDGEPVLDLADLPLQTSELRLLINARVAIGAQELECAVRAAVSGAAVGATVLWDALASFEPQKPVPVHRHGYRCGSGDDASCCAAFYDRPEVRFLLGDSLHPGGTDLTLSLAESLELGDGKTVLDVACGRGTSLRALADRWHIHGTGLDAGGVAVNEARVTVLRGDAHAIPFEAASFDAVLCECAVSTFADQRQALGEIRRVLRASGRVAVSDMVVDGPIPELLRPYAHAGACLAGARTSKGWEELFREAGFEIEEARDESVHLGHMIGDIKRKLVGLALARASGTLPSEVNIDIKASRALIRAAEDTLRAGNVRYGAWILVRGAAGNP